MSSPRGKSIIGILLALAVVAASFIAVPAGQRSPQQPPLKYEVSVTLKLIQVYVTDKSGKPVRDLTRDDFTLIDNGQRVAISDFERHDLAEAPAGVDAPAPEPAPVSPEDEAPALNRKFVILFDLAFNTLSGVRASLDAARHFLDTEVRPEDELAFISYSTLKGLRIHEFLTKDHAKVKAALAAITTKDIAGRADEIEQKYWLQVEHPALVWGAPRLGLSEIEMTRLDSMQQAGNYFRALTRLAQSLRLVQGQKSVLFFSNGIPSSLVNASRGEGTSAGISGMQESHGGLPPNKGSTFQVGNYELRPLQEALFREFSASACSIYAFDTRESSKIPALFAMDEMNTAAGGGTLGADGKIFRDDKTTGMDSLKSLSKQTGGKYYSNIILHEKSLEEVSAVTGTYYVLGYSITAAADGRFHDVKIEVKRDGCQVRTQPGYFNPKPFREYTDLEKTIHLFDLALNERSEFQAPKPLPISALAFDAGQGLRVRALARIPEGTWGQFRGETAEIVALFFDGQDALMSLQRTMVSLADHRGRDLLFSAGVPAKAGVTKCRVIVRDLDTGQSAVASTSAFSGQSNSQVLSVFSPLLIVEGGGLFHLEGVIKGAAESPTWRELYPYDAAASSPVIGGEAVGASKVGVILPYSAPGLGLADLTFRADLINASNGRDLAMPIELRGSTQRGSVESQELGISLEGVADGKYVLYIHVGNKLTGQVASGRVPLTIGR
jgi:VWFA-related protein